MKNEILIEHLTKLHQESQNQKLRLFAKVDITTKLKILSSQKQLFHKLKSAYSDVDNSILTLSSLILAIDFIAKEFNDVNLKAIKLRTKNAKKQNQKREKLLSYWSVVKTLKLEQNYSFREISDYLLKYHRFEVSYSLVYQTWNEIEIISLNKEN